MHCSDVIGVPEAADTDLGEEDDGDGDERREYAGESGGDDSATVGVEELRVDDVARSVEGDGERADGLQ